MGYFYGPQIFLRGPFRKCFIYKQIGDCLEIENQRRQLICMYLSMYVCMHVCNIYLFTYAYMYMYVYQK